MCRRYLMTQCVSMFMMDKKEKEKMELFVAKFDQILTRDEKVWNFFILRLHIICHYIIAQLRI